MQIERQIPPVLRRRLGRAFERDGAHVAQGAGIGCVDGRVLGVVAVAGVVEVFDVVLAGVELRVGGGWVGGEGCAGAGGGAAGGSCAAEVAGGGGVAAADRGTWRS